MLVYGFACQSSKSETKSNNFDINSKKKLIIKSVLTRYVTAYIIHERYITLNMETFNLLPYCEANDIFRVSFDFYTPRPQFVIIPKDIESIDPEFCAMSAEQTCILIEAVKSVMSCFRIPQGILSIHRGSWKSRPAKSFHCHLCVHTERYLEIFERKKKAIPNWPSVAYVTRQWGWNKDPRSYAQNVRGYPYKSRFKEDVSGVLELIQDPSRTESLKIRMPEESACLQATDPSHPSHNSKPWPQSLLGKSLTEVVYHPSHPKIGFVGKRNASVYDLHEMLWAIENFARAHGLTDTETEDKNYGCHICLYFGPAPSDWKFSSTSEYDIMGYLVTTGPRFYQLCPVEHRQAWFDEFQRSNFKCFT